MFLIDKYDSSQFFHKDIEELLKIMSDDEGLTNVIFYGSCSKKIGVVNNFLEMIYDETVRNVVPTKYKVTGSGNKKKDEIIPQSAYHIVNEPKNNNYDRYLIHDVIKEYAKRKQLGSFKTHRQFKTVLINNLDNMSYYAQSSLRRTMERFSDKCRFIMWCESLSKIMKPLRSRCVCIKIPCPTDDEIFAYTYHVAMMERIDISFEQLVDIVNKANGNVKKAMWYLEFFRYGYDLDTNYTTSIKQIVELILETKLDNIIKIRNILFSLMITNVDGTTILRDILDAICLSDKFDDDLKCKIVNVGAEIEHRMIGGRREIIQFEGFMTSALRFVRENRKARRAAKKLMT